MARLNRPPVGSPGGISRPIEASPPAVDKALVEYLRRVFVPELSTEYTLRDYDAQLGAKGVIDHLEALYQQQNPDR